MPSEGYQTASSWAWPKRPFYIEKKRASGGRAMERVLGKAFGFGFDLNRSGKGRLFNEGCKKVLEVQKS